MKALLKKTASIVSLSCVVCLPILIAGCATENTRQRQQEQQAETSSDTTQQTHRGWSSEQQKIQQVLPANVITIVQEDDSLLLRLPAAGGFENDKDILTLPLKKQLNAIIPALNTSSQPTIHIIGHTDSIGSERYNMLLSIRRAEAVMEYLRGHGIALARLSSEGMGESAPIADNSTHEGRLSNRRIEIIVSHHVAQ